jgi:aspartyl aminopeptidase
VHDLLFKSIVDLLPPSVDALLAFLRASPSPFHAVAQAANRLDGAGFAAVAPEISWRELPPKGYAIRSGALVAWASGGSMAHAPFRVVGAHTDSPNLRLKPRPDSGAAGWRQLAVEVYGGALVNSWLDRDLGLSGRIVTPGGETALVEIDRPLARVAQLAIHLDRDVNERGLVLDKQQHLTPIWGLGHARDGDFVEWLAAQTGLDTTDIAAWDLMFHDLTAPARLGRDEEFVASGRLDNLVSCWAGVEALVRSDPVDGVAVLALFDHEEVGSDSTTGAGGPLLETVIDRLVRARGGDADDRHRALAASICVSADMAHAVHPNYVERHEPAHRPLPNGGPVLKINVNQRYATNAVTAERFTRACERAGVPWQVFVSRNNMPCGSTIGPITATRLGIDTVDVGCAQLSMHSARELCGADDPSMLARAAHALFTDG